MGLRSYTCNLWKELRIGKYVKFEGGEFSTEDPELQDLIERNNAFGTAIHFKDSIEVMEEQSRLAAEQKAAEKARRRKQFLDELAEEERLEQERVAKAKDAAQKVDDSKAAASILAAADKVVEDPVLPADSAPEPEPSAFGGIVGADPAPEPMKSKGKK